MFRFIKQAFIALLSFSESLPTNMIRHTLIDLNPVEFNYYPFTVM